MTKRVIKGSCFKGEGQVVWERMLPNCGVLVSREHGGPEGMDPDGVIEVRKGVWILEL